MPLNYVVMLMAPSPARQAELGQLLANQQNPASPKYHVSPNQINIQIPYEAGSEPAVLGIANNGQGAGFQVEIAPSAPARRDGFQYARHDATAILCSRECGIGPAAGGSHSERRREPGCERNRQVSGAAKLIDWTPSCERFPIGTTIISRSAK
jgi:hypothetical protein